MEGGGCTVRVRFAGVLVSLAGSSEVTVKVPCGSTLRDLLTTLTSGRPKLAERIFRGKSIAPGIYIAVNDVDVRLLNSLSTRLNDGDTVLILSYIHGG